MKAQMPVTDYEAMIIALSEAEVDDATMVRIATSFAKHRRDRGGTTPAATFYSMLVPALVQATLDNDAERIAYLTTILKEGPA